MSIHCSTSTNRAPSPRARQINVRWPQADIDQFTIISANEDRAVSEVVRFLTRVGLDTYQRLGSFYAVKEFVDKMVSAHKKSVADANRTVLDLHTDLNRANIVRRMPEINQKGGVDERNDRSTDRPRKKRTRRNLDTRTPSKTVAFD
jgi:hypothetical protein